MNDKNTKYENELNDIQWTEEESYLELEEAKEISSAKEPSTAWVNTVEKYLDSIEYAVDKSSKTGKKISATLDKIPEPLSKKGIQITFVFLLFAILIFLIS